MPKLELLTIEQAQQRLPKVEVVTTQLKGFRDFGYDGLKIGQEIRTLSETAKKDFCRFGKVPTEFFYSCRPELRDSIFKDFFKEDTAVKIVTSPGRIESLIDEDDLYIPILQAFDMAVTEIPVTGAQVYINDRGGSASFNLITNVSDAPPTKVGDVSSCGVSVELEQPQMNKQKGWVLRVSSYLLRLVCTSGMLGTDNGKTGWEIKGKSEQEVMNNLKVKLQQGVTLAQQKFLPQLLDGVNHTVTDPAYVVHRILRDSRLPIGTQIEHRILERIPTLGDTPTMYDIINLITAMANDVPQITATRSLQRAAGTWLGMTKHRCNHCQRVI